MSPMATVGCCRMDTSIAMLRSWSSILAEIRHLLARSTSSSRWESHITGLSLQSSWVMTRQVWRESRWMLLPVMADSQSGTIGPHEPDALDFLESALPDRCGESLLARSLH